MNITEFLQARISEDEAEARQHDGAEYYTEGAWPDGLAARFLAECAAKRELIETWHDEHGGGSVLKPLAAVYSDHPDYQQEWGN